jgi:hypothetical protein
MSLVMRSRRRQDRGQPSDIGLAVAPAPPSLARLRRMGVRLSLDDFGTGQSTLTLLATCPVDQIKLDRSFVPGAGSDVIAAAVLQLARGFGVEAVAEGVETPAQAEHLAVLGYDRAQGFRFGRPMARRRICRSVPGGHRRPVATFDRRVSNKLGPDYLLLTLFNLCWCTTGAGPPPAAAPHEEERLHETPDIPTPVDRGSGDGLDVRGHRASFRARLHLLSAEPSGELCPRRGVQLWRHHLRAAERRGPEGLDGLQWQRLPLRRTERQLQGLAGQ